MKIKIELTPYQAGSILAFLREFINEDTKQELEFQAIHESVNAFENEIERKMTDEMMDDMLAENEVNIMLKKTPQNKGGKPL